MTLLAHNTQWLRRARPLLGTLVEIGVFARCADDHEGIDAAFQTVRETQACLSRFEPHSDVTRFHALRRGEGLTVRLATQQVLAAASALQSASAGIFDVTLGSARDGWRLEGDQLHKLNDDVRIDLGGIGKGHAVDLAVQTLIDRGCRSGWVNAGGDLRAFGDADVPLMLRDEQQGGTHLFAHLREGAFATSHFGPESRSQLSIDRSASDKRPPATAHASVAAPLCLWADALTKLVALTGNASHPLLTVYDASAWLH